jgi:cyclopropane fatty-acyl-phospholipid synthase-like methyltransferase
VASYTGPVPERPQVAGHYSAHYRDFAAEVYAEVRRAAFDEDIGQNSWLTAAELERFASQLTLGRDSRLLDVACGSGGPSLHLARAHGCDVVGVELYEEAVQNGHRAALEAGLDARARFVQADASKVLPFDDEAFDAILCIDAINHLANRPQVFADWARVLEPGGRLLFTDPMIVTGTLTSDELAIRTSIGYFLLVPPAENDRLLAAAGLSVISVEDTTDSLSDVARRRRDARDEHEQALRQLEGDDAFEGRQRFFEIVATLARERRLSRLAYLAERPT